MFWRVMQRTHSWIDYLGGATLLITGVLLIKRGTLLGIVLLVVALPLLLARVAHRRDAATRAVGLNEKIAVASIQDDGSLGQENR